MIPMLRPAADATLLAARLNRSYRQVYVGQVERTYVEAVLDHLDGEEVSPSSGEIARGLATLLLDESGSQDGSFMAMLILGLVHASPSGRDKQSNLRRCAVQGGHAIHLELTSASLEEGAEVKVDISTREASDWPFPKPAGRA